LDKFTSNPFLIVLSGILVTILIQSSSGTTVLTVAFVNGVFMSLRQAIGVIMGSNVGTIVTAFVIGFDIGAYSLPIMAIGSFMLFFFDKEKLDDICQADFGLAALFLRLNLIFS